MLKNLKGCMKAWEVSSYDNYSTRDLSTLGIRDVNNSLITSSNMYYMYKPPMFSVGFGVLSSYSARSNDQYIGFGTGTTPVTENDYKLDTLIMDGISCVKTNSTLSFESGDDGVLKRVLNFNTVYQNTTGNALTINEIGVFYVIPSNNSSVAMPIMIHREVLEEPINAEASACFTVKFTAEVDFNF